MSLNRECDLCGRTVKQPAGIGPANTAEIGWTTMHLHTSCEHQGQWYGHERRYDVCGDCGEDTGEIVTRRTMNREEMQLTMQGLEEQQAEASA